MRKVKWKKKVSRDDFSTPARNSLGSTLTVFSLDNHITEIKSLLRGEKPIEKEEEAPPYFEEVQGKAMELIADRISKLDPFDFQDLVAAVLKSMGYKTKVSGPGADRGVDILAHPDELGFETPVIKVQVKRQKSSVRVKEMRGFIGTLSKEERGLYVSTGGFTKEAINAARETEKQITILDRDDFIDLFLRNYENIDPKRKALVLLKKVYIPLKE